MYKMWAAHQTLAATDPAEASRRYGDPWPLTLKELTEKGMTEELVVAGAARVQRSGLIYGMGLPRGGVGGSEVHRSCAVPRRSDPRVIGQ